MRPKTSGAAGAAKGPLSARPGFRLHSRPAPRAWRNSAFCALLLMGGAVRMYVLCELYPADLPFWMPWEFSWPVFLVTALLVLGWFLCGCARVRLKSSGAHVAHRLLRARRRARLRRAADACRFLRPAHVLRASLGAFRAASSGRVPRSRSALAGPTIRTPACCRHFVRAAAGHARPVRCATERSCSILPSRRCCSLGCSISG